MQSLPYQPLAPLGSPSPWPWGPWLSAAPLVSAQSPSPSRQARDPSCHHPVQERGSCPFPLFSDWEGLGMLTLTRSLGLGNQPILGIWGKPRH